MYRQISVDNVAHAVNGRVVYRGDFEHIKGVVASGLMSDVLVTEDEGILLVSNLATQQVVRTADMVGAHAILITNAKALSDDMLELAEELSITLMSTDMSMFETCYTLGKLMYER